MTDQIADLRLTMLTRPILTAAVHRVEVPVRIHTPT